MVEQDVKHQGESSCLAAVCRKMWYCRQYHVWIGGGLVLSALAPCALQQ